MKKKAKDPWAEAKVRFGLSDVHVAMAKRLGLNPEKMGRSASTKGQRWKEPLPKFIEKIFARDFPKSDRAEKRRAERKERKEERRARRRGLKKSAPPVSTGTTGKKVE